MMENKLKKISIELELWGKKSIDYERLINECEKLRIGYANLEQSEEANKAWLLKEIARTHFLYVKAFYKMKSQHYYPAWRLLEQAEISLLNIKRNFSQFDDKYGLIFLENKICDFQKLFPYKIFFSGRYIIKSINCSICGKKRILGQSCGHKTGFLYNGELCTDVITDFEIITFDMVRNPVNKYAVPFMENEFVPGLKDHYDYTYLEITLRILLTPYDAWDLQTEKFYKAPPSAISPNDPCPCMQSLKSYGECCMKKPGIECLHLSVGSSLSPEEMALRIKEAGELKHFSSTDFNNDI